MNTTERLAVIETKLDDLINQNTLDHDFLKDALDGKADKWVEEAVDEIRKDTKIQMRATIGVLVTAIISIIIFLFQNWGAP